MKTILNLSARFDRVLFNETTCLIQNYKTGWKEPEPIALNAQMRCEALLVALNLGAAQTTIKRFIVQIISGPFGVMEAEFSFSELAQMYEDITGTLRAIENPHAELVPSPDACGKCPAILVCNAAKSLVVKLNPVNTDPAELARNLDKIKILREHMDEFEAFCAKGLLADPPTLSIAGYEMVPGAEKRDWKDLKAARTTLLEVGVAATDLDRLKSHTVAAYQKLYAEFYGRKPEDCKEVFEQLMDGVIDRKQNKASLKRVKRDAATIEAEKQWRDSEAHGREVEA